MRQFTPKEKPGTIARIGLIALSSDPSVESEWKKMLPDEDIAVFVARIPYASNCSSEHLKAMGPEMTIAASRLEPSLDLQSIAYGCTSGTASIGYAAVVDGIRQAHPGMPVSTPLSGALAACRQLEVSKISVVTPYTDTVNQTIADYLTENGIMLTGMNGFGLTNDNDIASIPIEALLEAALEIITDDTEAIFFSCTGLVMVGEILSLEDKFGFPVITSNQVMLWETLRKANYTKPIDGFGRLMNL
jgi:maleate isomerase